LEDEGVLVSFEITATNEKRFQLKDVSLRKFILEYWSLHTFMFNTMMIVWNSFSKMTSEESKWVSYFYGDLAVDDISYTSRESRIHLQNLPYNVKKRKIVKVGIEILRRHKLGRNDIVKFNKDFSQVISDYEIVTKKLQEIITPIFFKNAIEYPFDKLPVPLNTVKSDEVRTKIEFARKFRKS
jgi:hypothetical protein